MVKVLGHRGGRQLWPENSIMGFRNAVGLGVDLLEFDVHLSSDGVPVVIHDARLDRTTTGRGAVRARTVAELRECRLLGCEDESVTTLDAVLAALKGASVTFAVEIKTGLDCAPYPDIERIVVETLKRHGALGRSLVLSFVPACLERARAVAPEVGVMNMLWRPQADLQGGVAAAVGRLQALEGCIVAVQEDLLTLNEETFFRMVPRERLAVGITNDTERLRYWLGKPIRHISTDRPDVALALRDELAHAQRSS